MNLFFMLGPNNCLQAVFWMSSWQRIQFAKFGDVVTFDTTFKTNRFGFPLGCLVGVNNCGKTICFAMCYLARETADIFQWVFQKLLEATGNKPPGIIFTDEDPAMNLAIECVLPSAKHRLCAWHLERNLRKKLLAIQGVEKYKLIRSTFWRLVKNDFGEDYFDLKMLELNNTYKESTETVQALLHLQKQKEKWAKCFSKGLFCLDQSATSRVESINSLIKRSKMTKLCTMAEFTKYLDLTFNDYMKQEQEIREVEATIKTIKLKVVGFPFCHHYPKDLTSFAVEKFEEQLLFATMSLLLYELNITEDGAFANVRYNNGDHYLTHVVSVRSVVTADFKQRNEADLILPSAESLARVVIPLDCSCSWRANWKLPCRHMFVVACKSSSPIIPAETFYERWKWNIHTEFDHYAALSTTIYDESNLDEGNVNPEAKRRRSFINLMAYSKFVVSNAVAHGYEKEMLQYLQGFDSIMKAKSKETSSSSSAQSLSNNPQLITQKRGRKRGSTNISSQREEVIEFIDP